MKNDKTNGGKNGVMLICFAEWNGSQEREKAEALIGTSLPSIKSDLDVAILPLGHFEGLIWRTIVPDKVSHNFFYKLNPREDSTTSFFSLRSWETLDNFVVIIPNPYAFWDSCFYESQGFHHAVCRLYLPLNVLFIQSQAKGKFKCFWFNDQKIWSHKPRNCLLPSIKMNSTAEASIYVQ